MKSLIHLPKDILFILIFINEWIQYLSRPNDITRKELHFGSPVEFQHFCQGITITFLCGPIVRKLWASIVVT